MLADRSGVGWSLLRDARFGVAAVILCIIAAMAVAPGLFGADSQEICDLANSLERPSAAHWFGYDVQGCDYYNRIVLGARTSLSVGLLVVAFAAVVGMVLGTLTGYYEGPLDAVVGRVTDLVLAVPLVLGGAVVLAFVRQPGLIQVCLVLVLLGWPPMVRLVRAEVLKTKSEDYVMAARALGASDLRLLRLHILPNAVWPVVVYATVFVGIAISAEALLSFMGVGLQLPTVSWGLMLASIKYRVGEAPHLLIPAAFLTMTVAAFVLLGEAVRRATDPRYE